MSGPSQDPSEELRQVVSSLREYAEWELDSRRRVSFFRASGPLPSEPEPARAEPILQKGPILPAGRTLDDVRAELGDCRRCILADSRKNIVFGEGSPKAELVFVGEAPGADEDPRDGRS